jgi:hypothetical protein
MNHSIRQPLSHNRNFPRISAQLTRIDRAGAGGVTLHLRAKKLRPQAQPVDREENAKPASPSFAALTVARNG